MAAPAVRMRIGADNEPWLLTEVRQFSSVRDQARFVEAFLLQLPLSAAPEAEFMRFYEAFPALVALIFGLGGGEAGRASWLELGGPVADALLAPNGALLRALESHRGAAPALSYAFPLARLPAQLRAVYSALVAGPPAPQPLGVVPAFWRRKAQQARARAPPPTPAAPLGPAAPAAPAPAPAGEATIALDVFEYYVFCFCYYALAAGSSGSAAGMPPAPVAAGAPSVAAVPAPAAGQRFDPNAVYLTLLRRYLGHYASRPPAPATAGLGDDLLAIVSYFLVPPPLEPLSLRLRVASGGLSGAAAMLAPPPLASQPGLLGLQALQTLLSSAALAITPVDLHGALGAVAGSSSSGQAVGAQAVGGWFPLHELCWPGTVALLQLVAARAPSLPAAELTQAVRCWREFAAPWLMLPVGHAHADETRWLGFVWAYVPLYSSVLEQLVVGVHAGLHPPASAAHAELVQRLLQPFSAPLVRALQQAEAALLRVPPPPPPPASPGALSASATAAAPATLGPFVAARLAQLAGPAGAAQYEPLLLRSGSAEARPLAVQLLRFYRHEAAVRDALALLFGLVLPAALAMGSDVVGASGARGLRNVSPERDSSGQLTPQGRAQVARGLRKCSNLHVRPLGQPSARPPGPDESLLLVRATSRASDLLSALTGQRIQLRTLAAYATHVRLLALAAALWLCVRVFVMFSAE